jgi:hypothetical protein
VGSDRKPSEKLINIVQENPTSFVIFYAAGLQLVAIFRRFQLDLIEIIRGQGNHWNAKERAGSDRGATTWDVDIYYYETSTEVCQHISK